MVCRATRSPSGARATTGAPPPVPSRRATRSAQAPPGPSAAGSPALTLSRRASARRWLPRRTATPSPTRCTASEAGKGTLMADNYDLPIPTVSGTAITVDWLRNDPRRIYRLLRTLVMQNLIGWRLLYGRVDLTGTGVGIYEVTESIFSALAARAVRPWARTRPPQTACPSPATRAPDKPGQTPHAVL